MKVSSPAPESSGPASDNRETAAAVFAAAIASGSLVGQHVAGKATRDTLFLDHFGLGLLPAAMIGAAALSALAVVVISRALARMSPARVVPAIFAIGAALFLLEFGLSRVDERAATVAVYVHTALFSAAGMSAFWSLVNEHFDPRTAKRVVGRIAGGGTLGGVFGGVLVWRASSLLSVPTMLAVLAGMNVIGLIAALRFTSSGGASASKHAETDAEPANGLTVIGETPYLRDLSLLVLSGAVVQALLDWLLSAQASAIYGKGQPLLAFFALFNMVVGVVSFLAQASLSRPLLERLGLANTLKIEPVGVVLGCALALVAPRLSTVVLLRGVEAVTRNSLYRSAYELFYTPLPLAKKRPTKTLIDVGVDRIGTAVGSVALLLVAQAPLALATRAVLFGSTLAAAVGWLLAARLKDGYVAALAAGLKSGAVALGEDEPRDITTRRTLAETTALLDREKLLARIEELHRTKEASRSEAAAGPGRESTSAELGDHQAPLPSTRNVDLDGSDPDERNASTDPLVVRAAALRSNDPSRIRAALLAPFPVALASFAVPLLANDLVARDTVHALRRIAPKITGMLLDTLVDTDVDPRVRRRVPRVFKACRTPRAASGLLLGLADPVFEVRVQVGLALRQMHEDGRIPADREALFSAVLHEVAKGRATWPTNTAPAPVDPDISRLERRPSEAPTAGEDDLGLGLAHVFTLLGLVLEREPLAIAYRALRTHAGDAGLRGTALEYLEAVLPTEIRDVLMPLLGESKASPRGRGRGHSELAAELLRSHAPLPKPITE